jgi:hypothetical protein
MVLLYLEQPMPIYLMLLAQLMVLGMAPRPSTYLTFGVNFYAALTMAVVWIRGAVLGLRNLTILRVTSTH